MNLTNLDPFLKILSYHTKLIDDHYRFRKRAAWVQLCGIFDYHLEWIDENILMRII